MIIDLLEYKSSAAKIYFGVYALETYLNTRQHRKLLEKEVPEAIKDVVSAEDFEKERLSELEESRYRFVKSALLVTKNYAFIKYDIYPFIWKYSKDILVKHLGLSVSHWCTDYLVASAIIPSINAISGLPLLLYDIFVAVKKHRSNPQTEVKKKNNTTSSQNQFGISLGLSPTIDILSQLYLLNQGIPNPYLYAWLLRFSVSVIDTLFPEIITQLFMKTEPLPEGELKTEIEALSKKIGFPLKKVFIFQKRAHEFDTPNVYIYQYINTKNIIISDAFIKKATKEEVCALISRELSICRSNHGLKKLILNGTCSLGALYAFSTVMQNQIFYQQFGFNTMPILFGCTMFNILLTPLKPVVNSIYNLIFKRTIQKANTFAKSLGYTKTLKSSLIKSFSRKMYDFNVDPLYSIYRSKNLSLTENLESISKTKE